MWRRPKADTQGVDSRNKKQAPVLVITNSGPAEKLHATTGNKTYGVTSNYPLPIKLYCRSLVKPSILMDATT
jgi:hypothetical protein